MAQNEIEEIQKAIEALENQRALLGDSVVETAVASLHEKLAALEAADHPDQQRKLVTTIFLDIVNSTAMVRNMDPEDHLAIMDGAMQQLTEPIEVNGGRVLRYMGDGLLALFGHPVARENDPEMAVRAALKMLALALDYAIEVEKQWGIPDFAVRIGMSTGVAIIGGGAEGENTLAGRHVNLAARLESAAPPGGLLISHSTYQQVSELFDIEPQIPINAKGFAKPQDAYLVIAARPGSFLMPSRGVGGVASRMIGRDKELALLQETFTEFAHRGTGSMITISGEAGIGKSRLLAEFGTWLEKEAENIRIIQGKAHPQLQASPYGLLRDLFSAEFALQEDENVESVRRKFEQGFSKQAVNARNALEQAHFVGQLLAFDFRSSPYLKEALADPKHLQQRGLAFIGEYIESAGQSQPTVIFLEDLHWADNRSLDVLNILFGGQSTLPVMIVAMARPNLFQRYPNWGQSTPAHRRVNLQPLTGEDCDLFVSEMFQRVDNLPLTLRELVVENAEGNPFYLEELVKMLFEEGVIIQNEGNWSVREEGIDELHIPPSLTGVIQARLDRLDPIVKEILQQASVIGRTFWDDSVAYVHGGREIESARIPVAESLEALQDRELVFPQPTSRFAGTKERLFKHALLRDVAYESVLKRLRRKYHGLAADWLIENSGERKTESAGPIADHLLLAGREAEAVQYLAIAAQLAVAAYANNEAISYLQIGLEILERQPDTVELIDQRIEMLAQLGRLYFATEGIGSLNARHSFEKGMNLADQGGTPRQKFAVLHGLSGSAIGSAEWEKALIYGNELLEMAQASGYATLNLWAQYSLGVANIWSGNLNAARKHQLTLLELYKPEKHGTQFRRVIEDPRLSTLTYLAWISGLQGYPEQSAEYEHTALLEAENVQHPYSLVHILVFVAANHYFIREGAEKVCEFAQKAMVIAEKENIPIYLAWANTMHGWSKTQLDQEKEVIEKILGGIKWLQQSGNMLGMTCMLTILAEAYRTFGELGKALETVDNALALVDKTGERFFYSEINRLKGELLWQRNAESSKAESYFQQAIEIARNQQARLLELRAAISLARFWQAKGKTNEAHALLSEIYSWFTEGFDTADLQEASVLLDELA